MNAKIITIRLLIVVSITGGFSIAQETHVNSIIEEIIKTRKEIVTVSNKTLDDFIFLPFWDFDGSILSGDCSEGLNICCKIRIQIFNT